MIRWRIDEMPCGKAILTLMDDRTGVGFALAFPDLAALRRFFEGIADGAERVACGAGFEAMSAFVEAFPERF